MELDHACNFAGSILPFLRLPHLKKLRVFSLRPGQVHNLADTLPQYGSALLAGATKLWCCFDTYPHSTQVNLSGNGVDVSLSAYYTMTDATTTLTGFPIKR